MKKVKVRDVGIQLNGKSYFKNNILDVSDEDFIQIKDYVDILEEDKKVDERSITIKVENESLDLEKLEKYLYQCLEDYEKNTNNANSEEKELEELKEKAKELGIKNAHLMKKETLEKEIAEKEAPLFGTKTENADGKTEKNDKATNTNENITGEKEPQE